MSIPEMNYDGAFYKAIGDFQREKYLEKGYVQGTVQEVDFLSEHLDLQPDNRIFKSQNLNSSKVWFQKNY